METKELFALLGINGIAGVLVYLHEPAYLKWVLLVGLATLLSLFTLTKQGRVSIYGTQIVMALMVATRYF